MFAKACEKAMKFTHPMVVSTRTLGGDLASHVSTYFFISKDGWALTAAHCFNPMMKFKYDQEHINEMKAKQAKDPSVNVYLDPTWISNHSIWFGADSIRTGNIQIFPELDLAAFKLENVPPKFIEEVAVLGDADKLQIGTSLCRLGYPFVKLVPTFEDNNFRLPAEANNLAPFPNEGILTRKLVEKRITKMVDKNTGKETQKEALVPQLETSSPGLKGQSGGPIFDSNGIVYAIQQKTMHLDLGFAPTLVREGVPIVENQFLNTGVGLHSGVIKKVLSEKNIPFETVSTGSDGASYIIN